MKIHFQVCKMCALLVSLTWNSTEMDNFTAGAKVAYEGLRLSPPDVKQWPVLHRLVKKCLETNPNSRPDFDEICKTLEELS